MAIDIAKIKITDYSPQILSALRRQVEIALRAIGNEAEGYAKDNCPVDTGRLRNSITFATNFMQSPPNTNKSANGKEDAQPPDYAMHATPEKGYVYIGTNVDYAILQEYGNYKHTTGAKHFLRDALANHIPHYKAILEAALK